MGARFCVLGLHGLVLLAVCLILSAAPACKLERRRSNAELGLNPQQIAGRQIFDDYCDRCHEPYSSRGKKATSLKGVFKRPSLSVSGMPANDERVSDIVVFGRNQMPGFGQVLSRAQVSDLLAYLHTL
jgi:mono/diheme cytochrome c family protein